jgi:hypothetical protein
MAEDSKPTTLDGAIDQYLKELQGDEAIRHFMPSSSERQDIEDVSAVPLAKFRRKQAVQTIRSAAALELLRFMPKVRAMLDSDKVGWSTKLKAMQLLLQYGVGEQRDDKLADALARRGGVLLLPPENPNALPLHEVESLSLPHGDSEAIDT